MLDASLCEREEFGVAYCRVFLSVLYDGGMWYTHYSLDSVTCKHVQQLYMTACQHSLIQHMFKMVCSDIPLSLFLLSF